MMSKGPDTRVDIYVEEQSNSSWVLRATESACDGSWSAALGNAIQFPRRVSLSEVVFIADMLAASERYEGKEARVYTHTLSSK